MKHQAQFLQVLLWCFLLAMTLSSKTTAQSEQSPIIGTAKSNSSIFNRFYLEGGLGIGTVKTHYVNDLGVNAGVGLTLITPHNWIITGRFSKISLESPEKPRDFFPYKPYNGCSLFSGCFELFPEKSKYAKTYNTYNVTSLLIGKIFNLSDSKTRLKLEGGMSFLHINEAVDFIKVNYDNFGYKHSRKEYNRKGASFRVGVEFPFLKYSGLGLTFDGILAKQEHLFGAGISLMFGPFR